MFSHISHIQLFIVLFIHPSIPHLFKQNVIVNAVVKTDLTIGKSASFNQGIIGAYGVLQAAPATVDTAINLLTTGQGETILIAVKRELATSPSTT